MKQPIAALATLTLATGGFSRLFEGDRLFDVVDADLVLIGLERALALNPGHEARAV